MFSLKNTTKLIAATLTLTGMQAFAHVNIAPENAFSLGDNPREYLEGKSAYINVNIPHSCSNTDHSKYFPTTDVVVILPNSMPLSSDFMTQDRSGNIYSANAVMGTKARVSANWKKVAVVKGSVTPFYSHGVRDTDIHAIKWLKGHVDNDHYDNLEFKTSLPKIDPQSCVGELKVMVPAVQYCSHGYTTAWIGTTGSARFPADSEKLRLEETYTPYFKVVRDIANNPYPDTCATDAEGTVIPETRSIRPSDADIDMYASKKHRYRHHRNRR